MYRETERRKDRRTHAHAHTHRRRGLEEEGLKKTNSVHNLAVG